MGSFWSAQLQVVDTKKSLLETVFLLCQTQRTRIRLEAFNQVTQKTYRKLLSFTTYFEGFLVLLHYTYHSAFTSFLP